MIERDYSREEMSMKPQKYLTETGVLDEVLNYNPLVFFRPRECPFAFDILLTPEDACLDPIFPRCLDSSLARNPRQRSGTSLGGQILPFVLNQARWGDQRSEGDIFWGSRLSRIGRRTLKHEGTLYLIKNPKQGSLFSLIKARTT